MRRTGRFMARLDPLEQRRAWRAIVQPNALAAEIRVQAIQADTVPARWIIPVGVGDDAPVIVYFHGGSYRYGSFESHAELVSRLGKAAAARVLFVEYRLAPPDRFPAAVDDAVAALRWLGRAQPLSRIVVSGDSAGGALALAALITLRDAGEPLPRAALLICPWVDVSARNGSLSENAQWDWALPADFIDWAAGYADEAAWQDPRVSPSYANLAGLPPLFIQVGGAEMLLDQVRAFALKAEAAGVAVRLKVEPDMIHNWHLLASISPVAARSIAEAGAFVREQVAVPLVA
ncbi:MAG TPA: alpha/beta hydrolase [Pseudomonadota bacterium]|nr:alpha/beta hydrolase [Pseudomonadota bacterium]HRI50867.1 alpha/beta hydrolase [Pseudomonadota bacterium]